MPYDGKREARRIEELSVRPIRIADGVRDAVVRHYTHPVTDAMREACIHPGVFAFTDAPTQYCARCDSDIPLADL
jgi:hypothetical protein